MLQICAQVIGNDATITLGGMGGVFELNVMLPVIAYNLLESITILSNGCDMFRENLVQGLKANEKTCEDYIEGSLAMAHHLHL